MKPSVMVGLALSLTGCVSTSESPLVEPSASLLEQAESRVELGLGYLEHGDMARAKQNLERALEHMPDYYRAQLSMAYYYEAVGDTPAAAQQYRQTLKQHPSNSNLLNNYGTFLCKQGKYGLADIYFNKAIHQPNYYQADSSYENAAFCALKSGDKAQAKTYFQQAINHNPYRLRSLYQLTQLNIAEQEYQQARQRLLQFQEQWGVQRTSLELLIQIEDKAGNSALKHAYQQQLLSLTNHAHLSQSHSQE